MGVGGWRSAVTAVPVPGRLVRAVAGSRLRLLLAGLGLVLLLWLLDAAVDTLFFPARAFGQYLLAPSPHQVAAFSLFLLSLGSFLCYQRRLSRLHEALEDMLQEALQNAEAERAKLAALIDTIPNPIYYQDTSGRFLGCNGAFSDWLARPAEAILGRTLVELAPLQVCQVFLHQTPKAGQGTVSEATLTGGDGSKMDVIFYKSAFHDGAETGTLGVMVDITQRKRAEEEISELNEVLTQQAAELHLVNRELEAFCQAISRDLRAPLTKISCSGQELREHAENLGKNGVFFVKSINDGCAQVGALLDALLTLSRAGGAELNRETIDLSGIAEEKAAELYLAEPGRRVSFRIAPSLLVQGDLQLLKIAVGNLIRNAWKYTAHADQPSIEFGAYTAGDGKKVFYLKDNGAGFDNDCSDQLFKPFRRLHSHREFPGAGLGLATVQRVIRRHKGRVWGEGKPGCGATFYFTVND